MRSAMPRSVNIVFAEWNVDLAVDLGGDCRDGCAPLGVPSGEPMGDAQEARPPKGAGLGKIVQRCEMRLAERDEFADRIGRQVFGK